MNFMNNGNTPDGFPSQSAEAWKMGSYGQPVDVTRFLAEAVDRARLDAPKVPLSGGVTRAMGVILISYDGAESVSSARTFVEPRLVSPDFDNRPA